VLNSALPVTPYVEHKPAARTQDTEGLSKGSRFVGEKHDAKLAHDIAERLVQERQRAYSDGSQPGIPTQSSR
jgi:hypothetical protein